MVFWNKTFSHGLLKISHVDETVRHCGHLLKMEENLALTSFVWRYSSGSPVIPLTHPVICPSHSHQIRSGPFDCTASKNNDTSFLYFEELWRTHDKIAITFLSSFRFTKKLTVGARFAIRWQPLAVRTSTHKTFADWNANITATAVSFSAFWRRTCV